MLWTVPAGDLQSTRLDDVEALVDEASLDGYVTHLHAERRDPTASAGGDCPICMCPIYIAPIYIAHLHVPHYICPLNSGTGHEGHWHNRSP